MAVGEVAVKRLGALPVIGAYLERLGLKERVDALAPVREVAHLSNGAVVAALVANRLTAPRPLYDIVDWAEDWAVEETLGIRPTDLNDDRLGRCLDDVAAVHDRLRGELTVQAIAAFGLRTTTLRWDLTSVLVTGAYPEAEQQPGYARLQYGYGGGDQKQVRYLQVTTDDGAVPLWDQVHDGSTADVATVVQTMRALREHAGCSDFVLVGDSKLLSVPNRAALLTAGVGYLAPLARTPELDAAFLAIPPAELVPLDYVSQRERGKSAEERASYQGWDSTAAVAVPAPAGGVPPQAVRRLFVVSSEERDAARRNRARQRERAEAEIARVIAGIGGRWYPTVERARAKIEAILDQRRLGGLYRVSDAEQAGRPALACELVPAALARAEALDGYYVLETTRPAAEADPTALLTTWKGQWQVEHRHRDGKGPLRIRPLFVTSNRRIVGLVTILGIALMVFSLLEREARRTLGAAEKVADLLAGHVAARPTGDNLLKALREISLVTFQFAGTRHRAPSDLTPLHRTLLRLLGVPEDAYARLAA
ncbi:MAG TPA: IS1634 family transposase [Chloroflexota bacterium]